MKAQTAPLPTSLAANRRLSTWLFVDTAARQIELRVGKVEIGQGIGTALLQIAADELGVQMDQLRLLAGSTDATPDELWTSASISVEVGGAAVRLVTAQVRTLFAQAAQRTLAPVEGPLRLCAGCFSEASGERALSYWDLAQAVDLDRAYEDIEAPALIRPAPAHVGRPVERRDLVTKLKGGGFVHDLRVPGMLHGRVLRAPRPGSRLIHADVAALQAMPGVQCAVVDGSFVAVCCEDEHAAMKAQAAGQQFLRWSDGSTLPPSGPLEGMLRALPATASVVYAGPAQAAADQGPPGLRVAASYLRPYLAHASIGTCCALAVPQGEHLRVFSHSQGVFPLRQAIADGLRMDPALVSVVHSDGAGCYGHNGADDVAFEAALMARASARPVRAAWSREEELTQAPFGPAMLIDIAATVCANGRVQRWRHEVRSTTHLVRPGWGQGVNLLAAGQLARPHPHAAIADPPQQPFGGGGDRNAIPLYRFGGCEVVYSFSAATPLRSSALRSLGAHANVFAIESMLDELACACGSDPLSLRLAHLDDPRAVATLQAAVHMAGWVPQREGTGEWGWGLAFGRYKNRAAYFAVVVEVALSHVVRVTRVHAAVDCGLAINPDGVRNQIEGGIVQAISWTLKEEVRWTVEGFTSRDWASYPILRFDEVPEVTVQLLHRPDEPPLGVGECTMGPVAAAIANAVQHAAGARVREMPITFERIAAAA